MGTVPFCSMRVSPGLQLVYSVTVLVAAVNIGYGNLTSATPTERDDDLQSRTERILSEVREYQTVIPQLVNEHGRFLSYNVQKQDGVPPRRKRGTARDEREILRDSDISEYRIFYRFSVFGKEFHFDLTLNTHFLSSDFLVEYHDRSGILDTSDRVANCYYIGQSREPFISTAAISNCNGLHGVFSTEDEDYFVEPLWNHTNQVDSEGHPHIVYKRSSLKLPDKQAHCGVQDTASSIGHQWLKKHWQLRNPSTSGSGTSRDSSQADAGEQEPIMFKLKPRKVYDIPFLEVPGSPPGRLENKHSKTSKKSERHDTPTTDQNGRKTENKRFQKTPGRRKKRDVTMEMPERTVETLVVIDRQMHEFHKSDHILQPYVLTIMNIVAKLYRDASIGNNINIVVSKLIVLTQDKDNLSISHHADRSLDSFCKWQHRLNSTSPHTHDNAVLMTRYDICTYKNKPCGTLGLAPVAGMCEGERSCSINEDIGLASAFTIAHEIGHNFGMQHDGAGNLCGTPGMEPARIMAARLTSDTDPFLWSNCSRQYITDFLESGRGSCLETLSSHTHQADVAVPKREIMHDANKQCRLQFHNMSRACKILEICRELWCTNEENQCITNSIPASDGTPCRNDSHGFHGQCYRRACRTTDYKPRPVDGGWSQWSGFSDCSRTCGGGVRAKERICNNPKPSHGGKYCVGERKQYKSCNMKICASGTVDFRKIQCEEYNTIPFRGRYFKWVPFTGAQSNPCALNCMADGFNFYTERASKVIDGTACYPDRLDMCINGECHHVGCDGQLGSVATEDKCRVCAGDGSSCHTISGMVDKSLPKGAYQEILKIPTGAMHIQVQEAYESVNYLALKSENGPFYINGDWTIDWPRKFTVAGTVFHYERQNDAPEILRAVGPTSENLVVMLLLQEDNQGVQYEYNVPYSALAGNHNVTQYTWTHSAWSQCSYSCGKGMSTSNAVCVHKYRQTIVDDGFCFPQPKPSHHFKHCNQEPCPSHWEVGSWSRCSQTCGGGRKTRPVVCKQRITQDEEVILDSTECPGNRPNSERLCKRSNCPAMWMAEDWTECSKRCGRGEMVRHVYCMTSDKGMYLDDSECEARRKPATIATCVKMACPQPSWVVREWSECSGNCNGGWQRRRVQCKTHDGESSKKCDITERPGDARKCDISCQEATTSPPEEECVDNYNFAYCPLVLKFRFCDREYFLKMCCKTCQIAGQLDS